MPSGTKEQKSTSSGESEQSSGGTKGTSKDKGKLYTEAQIHQIKTSAGGEAGRQRQAAEQERDSLKEQLQSTISRLNSLESQINESRLAEARGDPDQLRIYQREQASIKLQREVEALQADLSRREGQLKADREEIDKDGAIYHRAYIASKHGLEPEDLEELGISDPEVLEKVAAKLAAARSKESGEGEGEGEAFSSDSGEEGEAFTPDSGETTGGGVATLTPESVEKMSMQTLEKAIEKAEPKS